MRDVDIFQMALGLTPPREVKSCEFSLEKKRQDIRMSFRRICAKGSGNSWRPAPAPAEPENRAALAC